MALEDTGLSPEEQKSFSDMKEATQAPPVESAAEPAGDEPAEGAAPEAEKKPSMVPHAALHEERERRKATERELQTAREERARFDERLRVIQEMQKPAQQPAGPPSPDEDLIGSVTWIQQQLQQRQEQERQSVQQRQQTEQQQQIVQAYAAQAQEYASKTPEFKDAYRHLVQSRQEELTAMGYAPAVVHQILQQDEFMLAINSLQAGINPGERIMQIAKMRGFTGKAPSGDQSAADKVDLANEAQQRNKSLSQAGGTAVSNEMTADRLVKMSDDEFEAWKNKHPAQFKRLMGG